MFQISKPSEAVRLLHWTKELPKASDADPLGLELRLSARLSNELLYCITSITPRARYYSFFPWALQDYNERERLTKGDRGRVKGVLFRERAMVLGAVVHHDSAACLDGALGGSGEAIKLVRQNLRSYDLASFRHLLNTEGQFGAAYKGSLINLGVFKADDVVVNDEVSLETSELSEETQAIDVRELSPVGKRLADAFQRSVRTTEYVAEGLTLKDKVTSKALAQFGSRAGLCEIASKGAKDRAVLRDVFFAIDPDVTGDSHKRRRMTLLLLLQCTGQARSAGTYLSDRSLSDICYFSALVPDDDAGKAIPVKMPDVLVDIQERWRIFFTQSYLAVALQSMLVACVRVIRGNSGGMRHEQLMNSLNAPGLSSRFNECTGLELQGDVFQMSARELLALSGSRERSNTIELGSIKAPLSERQLEILLVEGEANEAAGIVFAALLFYQVALRHKQRVPAQYGNWYEQQIHNDYSDVALPGILRFLQAEFGENWLDRPNGEILGRIIWRFVIRQHQTMSYERGFGGGAPLFHVDGTTVVGTEVDFINPEARNPRLRSALQILSDLGLLNYDEENGYERTPEGETWLLSGLEASRTP